MTTGTDRDAHPRLGVEIAAVGVVAAVLLVVGVNILLTRGIILDQQLGTLLSYLVAWVPFLGAVLIFCFGFGTRSLVRDIGLRFRPLDVLWGLTVGVVARVLATIVEIAGYGQMGSTGATLGEPVRDLWWLFVVLLAPVVLSPLIEEMFFRGLVLRSVRGAASGKGVSPAVAAGTAVVVSAAVFALVHMIDTGSLIATVVIGVSTFLFGLGAGALAVLTGRLGGAIVAHVTFNALVVVPALLG
ncbi:type II CAAX prenyl endopeptidase Rce1 family protein [Cryobacterium sp. PAMC25264]|uniref:CPBP family glutamic-type intramembrane protease n=1 Tax=Cryobacterium sp. PAMC25264 TaxID=2861288 RepID=UPI001C625C1F|nr:CPBP family glutamic-type intramembrane protease [Cryobacterium sp. PAMC25264]QYF73727.1 CPBP family intramembrane metalloprotease [Cryobacterium sp. PAMC25264]